MTTVEPIRSVDELNKVKNVLARKSKRNFLLFVLGVNTGLRISDILKLRVCDIVDKKYIFVIEQKTHKKRKILISDYIKSFIKKYISQKEEGEYLFKSRKGGNKPISRIHAWRIINDACKLVRIKEHMGTHTMRKTFGYHFYKQTKDIALLQKLLNHSSPEITMRYIGMNQDIMDNSLMNFCL